MDNQEVKTSEPAYKLLGKIVVHLKEYPFLLITVAGLVILTIVLAFDVEKLKEFKFLLYGVVLIPIFMQFYFEARKSGNKRVETPTKRTAQELPDTHDTPVKPVIAAKKYSTKAIVSMIFIILCLSVYGDSSEDELMDEDLHYGLIFFSALALGFAISGWNEIKRNEATGKKLVIADISLSIFLLLSSIGWLMEI